MPTITLPKLTCARICPPLIICYLWIKLVHFQKPLRWKHSLYYSGMCLQLTTNYQYTLGKAAFRPADQKSTDFNNTRYSWITSFISTNWEYYAWNRVKQRTAPKPPRTRTGRTSQKHTYHSIRLSPMQTTLNFSLQLWLKMKRGDLSVPRPLQQQSALNPLFLKIRPNTPRIPKVLWIY